MVDRSALIKINLHEAEARAVRRLLEHGWAAVRRSLCQSESSDALLVSGEHNGREGAQAAEIPGHVRHLLHIQKHAFETVVIDG